jgi:hypothetical protein
MGRSFLSSNASTPRAAATAEAFAAAEAAEEEEAFFDIAAGVRGVG